MFSSECLCVCVLFMCGATQNVPCGYVSNLACLLVDAVLRQKWLPFKAYCCHMGTAIKHPVPDQVKPSFVIFDIRAL